MNLLGQEGPFIVLYQDQTTRPDRTSQGHFYFYDVLVINISYLDLYAVTLHKIMRINRKKRVDCGLCMWHEENICLCKLDLTMSNYFTCYLKFFFCKVSQKFWVRSSHPFEITIWSNFKYFQSLSLFREAQTYKNIMTESKVFL